MTPVTARVARVVRDLLGYDEQLIRLGRENYNRSDYDAGLIVVDATTPSTRAGNLESFDGDAEELSIGEIVTGDVTLDFYGDGAYSRAREVELRLRSQDAYDLAKANAVHIQPPRTLTDVKALTGGDYSDRWQLEMAVQYSPGIVIDTRRLESAPIQVRTERGVQYDG